MDKKKKIIMRYRSSSMILRRLNDFLHCQMGGQKFLLPVLSVILLSCLFCDHPLFAQNPKDDYYIEVVGRPAIKSEGSVLNDTIDLMFNMYLRKGTRYEERCTPIDAGDEIQVKITELKGNSSQPDAPTYIEGTLKKLKTSTTGIYDIPDDITISLLVDRSGSIKEPDMVLIREAVKEFIRNVPEGCLFYSWFDDDISMSMPLSRDGLEEVDGQLTTTNKNTALYNAIYTKLLEFDPDSSLPNLDYEYYLDKNEEISRRQSLNNYLIVLTDGKNDIENIGKYTDPGMVKIEELRLFSTLNKYRDRVKVFALGFGNSEEQKDILQNICLESGNPNGYFQTQTEGILDKLKRQITGDIAADYEMKLRNKPGKLYSGDKLVLNIEISSPSFLKDQVAAGSVEYARGSSARPMTVGKESTWGIMVWGFIYGLIFLLVMMIIIQLIIPLIKNKLFDAKYVKKYRPASNEVRIECPYCGDPLNAGELIVKKCSHIVHKVCWDDYGHVCPEYGQNCNDGRQDYFDITDPFSKKNKIYYLKWVMYGLISGFVSWIFFILMRNVPFVQRMTFNEVNRIAPNIDDMYKVQLFVDKISPLLLIGFLMGLFITLSFAYIEEYRRKNLKIASRIIIRGIIGSICGFLSFYLGSMLLILFKQPYNSIATDWIPWILFGAILGLVLSIRTTILWKHGLIGGLLAIIFGFIILFFIVKDMGYPALMIGFMIYGAGLGFSIATVRSAAEQYFLKIIKGIKHEETIPVHKWMSVQGGHNEVYIGRGFSCEIQMNWEANNYEIADRHAKMFMDPNRNIPVIVTLEKDKKTLFNDRIEMEPGKQYDLFSGNTIQIGNTVFQYLEKQ